MQWYRRETPALQWGSYRPVEANPDCYVYLRTAGEQRRLVALNFSAAGQQLALEGWGEGRTALSTYLDRSGRESLEQLELRPHEGLIIEL